MNANVFSPAGIANVSASPPFLNPTLTYPWPTNGVHGEIPWGDHALLVGAAGLWLSSSDIAKMLARVRDGTILDVPSRITMEINRYGWGEVLVRHGPAYMAGGFIGWSASDGRPADINTMAASFSTGASLGLIINGFTTGDFWGAVIDAYNSSWIPVP
jgi:hypothetical protein